MTRFIFCPFFENFIFSLRRAYPFGALRRPRGGPYFLLLQKVGKDRRKGVSPPCESPDQSGVLDAPLWKPPSLRWRGNPGRTPRRLRGWSFGAVGEGRERVRARLGCRTSTASGWGLAPPCPQGSQRGTFAGHARLLGADAPLSPAFPKGEARRSCANAHGTASEMALRATPSQICAEAPAAKRLGVPSLPSRGCGRRPL